MSEPNEKAAAFVRAWEEAFGDAAMRELDERDRVFTKEMLDRCIVGAQPKGSVEILPGVYYTPEQPMPEIERLKARESELTSALADALSGYRHWMNDSCRDRSDRELEVARADIARLEGILKK